ncbi:hydrogenobyrinic acid a,c-diamide synthase (glutamine-hydrolyzing) [Acidianus sulfidivorans JP7]|uniref:cobyrinate a,c-diamide synthase n=1 Tax=Acidianus sulfidivorans TaxID=312539 RepID=UPI0014433634|nr:cobyrinate a,c-diamide synthase [Acidianus sulfidivorans]AWR97176.2 hydrogenobyrinic acid a,c-diamide synthase (glutamine-hydrolyzing) [Acidianus sulfidivorans JP7]
MTKVPRILISSDRSNSGKTTITAGLMRALSKKMKVRPFKAGPDFIDPGYHKIATGNPSINLDLYIMGEENVKKSLVKYSKNYDIGIIEGVMGLYDGINLDYSTYQLSKVTKTPIILIINCEDIGSTAGAIAYGLKNFANAKIEGVIFNKISSNTHFEYCKNSVKDIKVLGYIPFSKDLKIPSRHLGLFTIEGYNPENIISESSKLIEQYVDLDSIIEIANNSEDITISMDEDKENEETSNKKIAAIAYDSAFSFYYTENIDRIKKSYNVKFFSPLNNETVEDADFIYLGGGYPELYLEDLEKSSKTKNWILKMSNNDIPILAECGGLMYLSKTIRNEEDKKYNMVGIYDIDIKSKGKLTIGYTELLAIEDSFLSNKGERIRGHEFHVSYPLEVNEKRFAFKNIRGKGIINGYDGVLSHNTLATYSHFHFSTVEKKSVF